MPTLFLKLMALSGVITAGCFAVWKANTELQPADTSASSQFTSVEDETGKPESATTPATQGPGGEIDRAAAGRKSDGVVASTEAGPDVAGADVTDLTEEQMQDQGEVDTSSADNGMLALADHPFAQGGTESDDADEPHAKPFVLPPPQDEPVEDEEPAVGLTEDVDAETVGAVDDETTPPEPGVSSLEALEKQERLTQTKAKAQGQAEGRVRLGTPPHKSAATEGPALRRFPSEIGGPALLQTRGGPQPEPVPTPVPRTRGTDQGVVQANAEAGATDVEDDVLPVGLPDQGRIPVDTSTDGGPEEHLNHDRLPEIRPSISSRTRGQTGTPAVTPRPTATDGGANLFDMGAGQEGQEPAESESVDESPAEETFPPSRTRPSGRPTQPTPISETVPGLEGEASEGAHSNVEDAGSTFPRPHSGSTIPSGSSIPRKTITPEMLIGDATVDDQHLAPTQQPQLRVEKRVQAEAEIGVEFIYEIEVKNVGEVTARHVVVEERIPKGCKMLKSSPVARLGTDRILRWQLDDLQAGQSKVIKVQVLPLEQGPVGSVATVRFAAEVSTKTIVTAPTLSLSIKHPKEVAVGEKVSIKFVITNTGNGVARNATLRAMLQEGLDHPEGLDIEQDPWSLAPGQTKEIDLLLTATEAAHYTPSVIVMANGVEQENRTLDLTVIESRLTLHREGHARRFVNRPAEFVTTVTNHSVDVMKDVMITERLPDGVTPVGEMGKFRWNPKDRTVQWKVSELGPGQYSDLKLTVVSSRAGNLAGKVDAVDAAGHRAELPTQLEVEGFSSLTLDFQGDGKAVAVGEQVSMRVTVGNKGTAPAKSVQAVFEIPPQMAFVDAKGPGAYQREGNLITFAELDELDANSTQVYDIVLTAAQEGAPTVSVELASAERPQPVRQEEIVTITPAP